MIPVDSELFVLFPDRGGPPALLCGQRLRPRDPRPGRGAAPPAGGAVSPRCRPDFAFRLAQDLRNLLLIPGSGVLSEGRANPSGLGTGAAAEALPGQS